MKKILRVYDRLAAWLCKWGSDKYVHLLAGLLVGYLWASLMTLVCADGGRVAYFFCGWLAGGGRWVYALCGFLAAWAVGLWKELIDDMRGGEIDRYDIIFTMAGGLIGALLFLIG